ncbi:MAG: sodium:solute symporter [Ruminococcaceae bacterium]|nr:sodium:solute symporter [Oscillospiraceae bacterium]
MTIKILLLVVFVGITVLVGVTCRKHSTNVDSFVLGGRSVGPWLTAFAYGTSYFSAVIFIGYAGQFGWRFGLASTWIGIGNALIGSLLAWVVLGSRTRAMAQHYGSSTMPDFFGKRYGSNALKIAAALIVFVFLIPYTASLYNGLSRLFEMAFRVDYTVCIVAMAILTCVYVVAGGYMATAINDFLQGMIMLIGIVAVVLAVLNTNGGLTEAVRSLGEISDKSVATGDFTSILGPDPFNLICVIILTSLGTWGLPQMVGKFYAIKDRQAIRKGTVVSTVFALVVAGGCYFLGGFGRLYAAEVPTNEKGVIYDAIIPTMLQKLPDLLIAVIVVLVLSASMSTLSSLVLTSSSTMTLDLIKGKRQMKEKKQVLIMRVLIVFFVAVSSVIAVLQYKFGFAFIAQLMGLSWGALAGAFLAPFLYGLYWKRTSGASVWVCFGFGTVVMLVNTFAPSLFPAWLRSPINCGAFVMLAGLVIVPIVSLLAPKKVENQVEEAFSALKNAEKD